MAISLGIYPIFRQTHMNPSQVHLTIPLIPLRLPEPDDWESRHWLVNPPPKSTSETEEFIESTETTDFHSLPWTRSRWRCLDLSQNVTNADTFSCGKHLFLAPQNLQSTGRKMPGWPKCRSRPQETPETLFRLFPLAMESSVEAGWRSAVKPS